MTMAQNTMPLYTTIQKASPKYLPRYKRHLAIGRDSTASIKPFSDSPEMAPIVVKKTTNATIICENSRPRLSTVNASTRPCRIVLGGSSDPVILYKPKAYKPTNNA